MPPPIFLDTQIERGTQILKQGGLVAFPTDTVYGLGADAFNTEAVERIYRVKGRSPTQPFPLLVADISQVDMVAATWTSLSSALARRFWPGALTLLLPAASNLPPILTSGSGTVGVRLPRHPVPTALARGVGNPIVGTSANLTGRASLLTAGEVRAQLGDRVDLVIDGGRRPGGVESTVVDATGTTARIVRAGAISKKALEAFLGQSVSLDIR
ncbi:MAG: L-threonylcarbamoyladenylate synthase [Dehalococcoidia bacterium]|nr:L-threonylcarbamoyladenylate synthase [Dehalococcoidia bacterium]